MIGLFSAKSKAVIKSAESAPLYTSVSSRFVLTKFDAVVPCAPTTRFVVAVPVEVVPVAAIEKLCEMPSR